MKTVLDTEVWRFQKALEAELEQRRNVHVPGGFIIPAPIDQEMGLTRRARAIAALYGVTTEQACFAMVAAMRKLHGLS